jgi:thiol-disulfide isomerase/thioredoxin
MKNISAYLFTVLSVGLLIAGCGSSNQILVTEKPLNLYQTLPDATEKKALVGIISKEAITNDTAFAWYQTNLKYFKLDSGTVQTIRAKKDKIHLVLFIGTWCHDSQQLVPKYFETLKAANVDDSHLTIVGTDRSKKTIAGLHDAFHITNVPTIIVLQNGKEIGRIIEYGSTTFVDKELGEIVGKAE